MYESLDNLVPKVHPLDRPAEADDPWELQANTVPGDPKLMLDCMLQEFLWLGCNPEQLLQLFQSPAYPLLQGLWNHYGEEGIRQQMRELVARTGLPQFRETLREDESRAEYADDHGAELVPLQLPPRKGGEDHAPSL